MLFTVSNKASSFGGVSNIGSTKMLLFSGFDQNAQINLITCKISELMAGSQYPQTTRSLLKTGLLLFVMLRLFLFSREKSSSPSKMDQPFPLTPSVSSSKNEFRCQLNSIQDIIGKLKICIKWYKFQSRDPSGFLNPGK